jgi:hypothetical protein
VPFEGAVEGKVELGQIKFSLEGQNYVLLTAMPTTRSEHVWVTHEPQYKLSQHMQGASDNRDMFMVRSCRGAQRDRPISGRPYFRPSEANIGQYSRRFGWRVTITLSPSEADQ